MLMPDSSYFSVCLDVPAQALSNLSPSLALPTALHVSTDPDPSVLRLVRQYYQACPDHHVPEIVPLDLLPPGLYPLLACNNHTPKDTKHYSKEAQLVSIC